MSKNIKKIIGYVTILQIVLYMMAVTAAAVIGGQTATYSGGETKTLSGGPTVTLSGGATRTLSGGTSLPTTTANSGPVITNVVTTSGTPAPTGTASQQTSKPKTPGFEVVFTVITIFALYGLMQNRE